MNKLSPYTVKQTTQYVDQCEALSASRGTFCRRPLPTKFTQVNVKEVKKYTP